MTQLEVAKLVALMLGMTLVPTILVLIVGSELIRTPTASSTALAIAAAAGMLEVSPIGMLLYGPAPFCLSVTDVLNFGIS